MYGLIDHKDEINRLLARYGVNFGTRRNAITPSTVHRTGRDRKFAREFRKVVMPFAYMTNGAMQIETIAASVP